MKIQNENIEVSALKSGNCSSIRLIAIKGSDAINVNTKSAVRIFFIVSIFTKATKQHSE